MNDLFAPDESRLQRARRLHELGRHHEALPLLEALCAQHPNFADLWHLLGITEQHLGELERAEKALRQALKLNPRYVEATLSLVVLLNDTGRYEAARSLYRDTLERRSHGPGPIEPLAAAKIANMHAELAHAYEAAQAPGDARREYERALGLCPKFADLRLELALLLWRQNLQEEAFTQVRLAIADRPKFDAARISLANMLIEANQIDEARALLRDELERQPNNEDAKRAWAVLERLSQKSAAKESKS